MGVTQQGQFNLLGQHSGCDNHRIVILFWLVFMSQFDPVFIYALTLGVSSFLYPVSPHWQFKETA